MNVSILVPNHNDLFMEKMIDSIDICCNNNMHIEVVIILNSSTPELYKLTEELKIKYKNKFEFNIIETKIQNLGYLYNLGINKSSYENIMFIDSDITCGQGSVKKTIDAFSEEIDIVKPKLIYKNMNRFIEKARSANTTYVKAPYIPVILFRKQIFEKIGYKMFSVDTVWCSDAEFANRILKKELKIAYIDAGFYHKKISIKKDLKDAILYGFGKGNRIKRTKEKWKPLKEICDMVKHGHNLSLEYDELVYLFIWISLQQIACGMQIVLPNIFENSLPYEQTAIYSTKEKNYENQEIS